MTELLSNGANNFGGQEEFGMRIIYFYGVG